MARISFVPPSRWSTRVLVVLAMVFFSLAAITVFAFVALGAGAGYWVLGAGIPDLQHPTPNTQHPSEAQVTPTGGRQPAFEYTTENGVGAQEGVVNSPLKISVHIPAPNAQAHTAP